MIRHVVELGWPSLLASALCIGIGAANWVRISPLALGVGLVAACAALMVARGIGPFAVVAFALVLAGLWWGGLRDAALDRSILIGRVGEAERAVVTVTAPPRVSAYAVRTFVQVSRFGGASLRERALLELPAGRSPPVGSILLVRVRVEEPRGPEDGFDERGWLHRQGIRVVLRGRDPTLIGHRAGLGGLADRLRSHIATALEAGTSGERHAILAGVVLGADEGLDSELKDAFRDSGLYHLLAVSGQNVALIAIGVAGLAWLAGIGSLGSQAWTIVAVLAYLLSVGWQPSVVRAGVAGCLASLAWLAARPRDRWYFFVLGALVLLAWNPRTLLDPGFQLSFVAVAAIFLLVPRLRRRLDGYPIPSGLADVLAVSSACGLASTPILLADFGSVPVYAVPANALAEPAVPAVLGLGLGSALLTPVFPSAGAALAWLASWPAAWLAICARLFGGLPYATVHTPWLLVGVALLAGMVAGIRRLKRRRATATALCALAVLLGTGAWLVHRAPQWSPPAGLRVTFLDVGQGDAALIEVAEGAILVDAGPPEADVAGQLRRMGIRSLSALVLTHPHRDHVGGAPELFERLDVGMLIDPLEPGGGLDEEEAIAAARRASVPVIAARVGRDYRLGDLRFRVLWPDGGGEMGQNPHLHAVVALASYGRTEVLLTADAEAEVQRRLPLHAVEVLKVAHHGSADPGLGDELAVLRPRVAVISVGAGNDYGHPRAETLDALAQVPGLRVYRTDEDGRVVVESDGDSLIVRSGR